jgi:hypothetical protein
MNTQTALVDGRAVQYSTVRMLDCKTPHGISMLPHRQGTYYAVLCRECGFGALGISEEQAAHYLLCTMNGRYHGHDVVQTRAHIQFNPELIDYIYDAYDPEGKVA